MQCPTRCLTIGKASSPQLDIPFHSLLSQCCIMKPYLYPQRTHILRLLGPKTLLYKVYFAAQGYTPNDKPYREFNCQSTNHAPSRLYDTGLVGVISTFKSAAFNHKRRVGWGTCSKNNHHGSHQQTKTGLLINTRHDVDSQDTYRDNGDRTQHTNCNSLNPTYLFKQGFL